jgi:hypothetical protein
MNSHFSQETLREEVDRLANRVAPSGLVDLAGRAVCAEARFEVDQTVPRMAYLAHLEQRAAN